MSEENQPGSNSATGAESGPAQAERTATSISVTRTIDAPPERVFALLADPDRHPDLDASGMVRASQTHLGITELGDVFVMDMHAEERGDYTVENHVVVYEPDEAIGWAPALPGEPPTGHTFVYRLRPAGDGTRVTQTYDWSQVQKERVLARVPVVGADALAESLDMLADALR